MAVCYDKLWKILIDKKMSKTELSKAVGMSSSTLAKLTKEEHVAMPVVEKICAELECNIADMMEFKDLGEIKEKLHKKKDCN